MYGILISMTSYVNELVFAIHVIIAPEQHLSSVTAIKSNKLPRSFEVYASAIGAVRNTGHMRRKVWAVLVGTVIPFPESASMGGSHILTAILIVQGGSFITGQLQHDIVLSHAYCYFRFVSFHIASNSPYLLL